MLHSHIWHSLTLFGDGDASDTWLARKVNLSASQSEEIETDYLFVMLFFLSYALGTWFLECLF